MPSHLRLLPALALCALSAAPLGPAQAASASGFSMEVLVDGVPRREYAHSGVRYVEAIPGREYSVRLTNSTGRRIAVALSVDGLNSIDARHASPRDSAKWVIEPWSSVTVPGWQVGEGDARRFFFTTEEKSYGAWLGDTRNLGNISAAVFREVRQAPPPPDPYYAPEYDEWSGYDAGGARGRAGAADSSARADEPAASGDAYGGSASSRQAPSAGAPARESARTESRRKSADDGYAATGIGRKVDHRVESVSMELESSPAAMLSVRYEYRPALVKLGVLPDRRPDPRLRQRERATGFAPDPYAYAPEPW